MGWKCGNTKRSGRHDSRQGTTFLSRHSAGVPRSAAPGDAYVVQGVSLAWVVTRLRQPSPYFLSCSSFALYSHPTYMVSPRSVPEINQDPVVQIFLSYNSRDRESVSAVRKELGDRGLATFYDQNDLTPGRPWFDELEAALKKVQGVAVFLGKDGLGTIQKREMQFAIVRQAQTEQTEHGPFYVVPVLLPGADPDSVSSFLALNTWVDLRSGIDNSEALAKLARTFRPDTSVTLDAPQATCPYRGLNVFREEDAQLYFGREAVSRELFDKVLQRNVVVLIGRSGSGKSSVAQAGLLPLLRRCVPPDDTWEAIICSPGSRPFHRLAAQLVPLWSDPGRERAEIVIESEKLGNSFSEGVPIMSSIEEALRHLPNTSRLLLILDQFEELFTLTQDANYRRRFVDQLMTATREANLSLVITLRADFYGHAIDMSPAMTQTITTGIVNVLDMSPEERRLAIEKPAERAGLSFEAGLVDLILQDIEKQPGSLPLLEYALTELWNRRDRTQLTHKAYKSFQGIEGAISSRAEVQFSKLPPAQQQIALSALSRLVRVSSGTEEGADTRQVIRMSSLSPDAQAVMRSFADREARLVVAGIDETNSEETVEVAHEALIRNWVRLKTWIDKDRDFLLWRQRLRFYLEEWKRQDKKFGLLEGSVLLEASQWLRERNADLSDEERAFIAASQRIPERRKVRIRRAAWGLAAGVLLFVSWFFWSRTVSYQVLMVRLDAPSILSRAEGRSVRDWLTTLALAGHGGEAMSQAIGLRRKSGLDGFPEVAFALAEVGDVHKLLATIDRLEKGSIFRILAMEYAASGLAMEGRKSEALALSNSATKEAEQSGTIEARQVATSASTVVMAETGDTSAINSTMAGPDDEISAGSIAYIVVFSLTRSGDLNKALAATRQMKPDKRIALFADVASALVEVGERERGREVADAAYALMNNLPSSSYDHSDNTVLLNQLALVLFKVNDVDKAAQLAEQAWPNALRHSAALVDTPVTILASVGKVDLAYAIAERVEDPLFKSLALRDAAVALAKLGSRDQSVRFASAARSAAEKATYFQQDSTYQAVAEAFALTDIRTSQELISKINTPSQVSALIYIAEALLSTGKTATAAELALQAARKAQDDFAGDEDGRSKAISLAAASLAKAHDFHHARKFAEDCSLPTNRLEAYTAILRAFTIQSDSTRAELFERMSALGTP